MDILAWSVLAILYMGAIVPFLGGAVTPHQSYIKSFLVGFAFHIIALILWVMGFCLFWALNQIMA